MLRLALIHGCPNTAAQYAQAAARIRGAAFTAVAHADETTRHDAARLLGVSLAAATLDELLSSHGPEFDAVLIRGPVLQRPDRACRAAEAGKHVCLTTPAAISEPELDRIAAACRAAGAALMLGSRRRFQPSVASVKGVLDSGKLGSPALLRCHHWQPRESGRPDVWERAARRSPGAVWSEIVNHLELAVWLFGRAPTQILAQGRVGRVARDHWPDYLQLHLGFPEGGMALISLGFGLPAGDGYEVLSLIGSTGAAYADDHPQRQLVFRGDAPRAVVRQDDILMRTAHLRAFVNAVANNDDPSHEIGVAKTALRLADSAWRSLAERRPVTVAGEHHVA
jgi:myo-inositol 2-dehydrogenase/D-chiro-inositol 1-dehydrogenase